MAYIAGAGSSGIYTPTKSAADQVNEVLGNIRGSFANDGRSYKDKTGQAPLTEKAQDTVEDIVGGAASVLDVLIDNWKLLLIAFVGLIIVLRK